MTKKEFKKWVDEMVRKYNADFKVLCLNGEGTGYIIEENKIIVLDAKTGKTGMARCHEDDKFKFETGLAIAYARLKGFEVPEIEEESNFERVEKGKIYYSIGAGLGSKIEACWESECNTLGDIYRFKNNNYFHTKERAEEVADKINFLLKLERLHDTFCPNYKPDWDDECITKYCVHFDYENDMYDWDDPRFTTGRKETEVYFPSKAIAEKVCNVLNEDLKSEGVEIK
jgi:hypothetical protein